MKRLWLIFPLLVASIPQCGSTPAGTDGGDGGGEGGCTKDCLGGACNAGMCAPVALATKQGGPIALAQLGDRVFWTDYVSNDVTSADKLDASLHVLANSPLIDQPWGITADDTKIYVANSGTASTVLGCPPDQCSLGNVLDDSGIQPTNVYLAGNFLYYIEPFIGQIFRTPKGGGAVQNLATTTFFFGDELFSFVASDGNFVYWSEPNTDKIRRQAVSAQPEDVFTLAAGSFPSALLIDGTTLYFVAQGSTSSDGVIGYGNLDGTGGPQTLASNQQLPWQLAVDATYIYWTTSGTFTNNKPNGDGGVFRCEKVNCTTPVQLAGGLADARGIAVDDKAIYFTTYATGQDDGTIWRLAK